MPINTEVSELSAAITALEAQRPLLGDAVVDAALGPMREKLAALQSSGEQQRKAATILFADVSGFTALAETMDAELVATIMNDLWVLVDRAIVDHGGRIDKHIGDAVMAVWGADTAREDDPEQAIRSGLAVQAAIGTFCKTHSVPLALRIGINTGPVLLGHMGTTGEFTAIGDAVNLANRLEHAAPVGGVLISHDTYRSVRGVFDVLPQEPLTLKGKAETVQTYIVQQAKPRAFRMSTRGVEGLETRMIGRDAELLTLQNAFRDAMGENETRLVTITGEAGVGKSRLLYEFDNWLELQPEIVYYFKGRATPNLQNVAFGLLRDLFTFRFNIKDGDSAAVALEKFHAGMDNFLEPAQVDIIGQALGFDFSASAAVQPLLGSPDFGTIARAHLTRYFRAHCAVEPLVILLEDIHWADDLSLDFIAYLVSAIPAARLLIFAVARPSLQERRPDWLKGEPVCEQVLLTPLSRHASRALIDEILRRVDEVPDALHKLIIDTAEGNPFYVEELIKMLIDQGIIERGHSTETEFLPGNSVSSVASENDRWQIRMDQLTGLAVPPTLTGLLQARLDGLPRPEREVLQQASIIGRLFWDDAVAYLAQTPLAALQPTLTDVRERELIFRREQSSFGQVSEYIFKHSLLRDVAYGTVLLKHRTELHGRVARWLEARAGDRQDEYLTIIAEHYALAGEREKSATLLERAGDEAMQVGAFAPARRALERALALRDAGEESPAPEILWTLIKLGLVIIRLGDFQEAEADLRRGLVISRHLQDTEAEAEALNGLGLLASQRGDYALSRTQFEVALSLATGDKARARALLGLSSIGFTLGDADAMGRYAAEALACARAAGDLDLELMSLNGLSLAASVRGEVESIHQLEVALELSRRSGQLSRQAYLLNNIGSAAFTAGDVQRARTCYQDALDVARDLGEQQSIALALINLAQTDLLLGDVRAARRQAAEGLALARSLGTTPWVLFGVHVFGQIAVAEDDAQVALRLFGLIRAHPALDHEGEEEIAQELAKIDLPVEAIAVGLAAGASLDLDTVVAELLAEGATGV